MMTKAKDCVSTIPALYCALANHDVIGKNANLAYEDTNQTLTVSMKQNPFDQINQLVDPTGNVTSLHDDALRLTSISLPTFNQAVNYDGENRIKQVENVLSDADN
ncbi:MAG: hypothetical protein ACI96P_001430 [Candidatus Azotimanducaceae bacterium]|jgi:hypothetical protein